MSSIFAFQISSLSIRTRATALTMATAVALLAGSAHADACDDECDNDEPPCTADERCPASGVECVDGEADYDQCVADAKAKGLELRCVDNSDTYCDPGEEIYVEEDGCSLRVPKRPSHGLEVAGGTFAFAVAAMILRARRRARERGMPR